MQLDLKKIPFGRRLSRHLIYEETDNSGAGWARGLYLALAAEGAAPLIGGSSMGPKGLFRVTPVSGAQQLLYTYTATPFSVELKTEKGTVRFALDGAKILRIEGRGVGLRLDGKLSFGGNGVTTNRGIEILQGGAICLFKTLRGKAALDCRWDLKALHCTDPVVTIEPDDGGVLDVVIYDTDDAYELPEPAESLAAAAAASESDYRSFAAGITNCGPSYKEFFDLASYALWMGFLPFKGFEPACANKLGDQKIYAAEQPVLTLPLKSEARSLDIIGNMLGFMSPLGLVPSWAAERQNLYEAVSPIYAVAVNLLTENGRLDGVSKEQLSAFYDAMSKAVGWWLSKRTNDAGLVYYAYRHECAFSSGDAFPCGAPSAAPDLASYIVLAAEALSKIAALLGTTEDAASWDALSRKQLDLLTRVLWDKDRFQCVNAFTGASGPAGSIDGLLPLLLGRRLPEAVVGVMADKATTVCWAETPVIPAVFLILGLEASGRETAADAAASALIESCIAGGVNDTRGRGVAAGAFYSPAACAALLSLGSIQRH